MASRSSSPVSPVLGSSTMSTENHLRKMCLSQLDMIHQLSQSIIAKDKEIKVLRENNSKLLARLSNFDGLTSPAHATSNDDCEEVCSVISAEGCDGPSNRKRRGRAATKDKSVGTPPAQPQINKAVQARGDFNDQENEAPDDISPDEFLFTSEPYFTFQGEDFVQEERRHVAEIMSQAEVPGWREMSFSPTYTMEGTENIEDETVLRRHQKFEFDEKRRKRWDIQRMREQRNIEKLRARYDDSSGLTLSNGNGSSVAILNCLSNLQNFRPERSLLPFPEQATHIFVGEELPVSAFGFPVPILPEQEFALPWIKK